MILDWTALGTPCGYLLIWSIIAAVLEAVQNETAPHDPDFLFRGHKYVGTSQPIFAPEMNADFDLELRRNVSIDQFAELLSQHLNKTREETETCFMTMSPSLEWTVHKPDRNGKIETRMRTK